ncbi:hypothetical protein PSENEW3_00004247 [Picochlorum sp. SENEW3]|nr:hypothetical protein PSENEW3_00004247 [Picochlorum sp. SENEW3]
MIEAKIELQTPQPKGAFFRPSKVSSFYGSHIAPPQLKLGRSASHTVLPSFSTDLKISNSRESGKRPRRDYEIFREEERKEIIASCPELMSDFDEGVFRAAAKAMYSGLDTQKKMVYRTKAAQEREAVASLVGLKHDSKAKTKKTTTKKKKTVQKRKKVGSRRASRVQLKEEHPTRTSPRLVAMKTKK